MNGDLCYCQDVTSLMDLLCKDHNYNKDDWRLFIDSGKNNLKAVLLHNGNKLPSVPIAHAYGMEESYESLKSLLTALNYNLHQWNICGDFKISNMLMGIQKGYVKHMCFLCLWDRRADEEHYIKKICTEMAFLLCVLLDALQELTFVQNSSYNHCTEITSHQCVLLDE